MKKEIEVLRSENEKFKSKKNENIQSTPSGLENTDYEKKLKRYKEIFQKQSTEFREAVLLITGYQIEMKNDIYRVLSMYADTEDDFFLFRKYFIIF